MSPSFRGGEQDGYDGISDRLPVDDGMLRLHALDADAALEGSGSAGVDAAGHDQRRGEDLRGKNLACWCELPKPGKPDLCHAAVLLEFANR